MTSRMYNSLWWIGFIIVVACMFAAYHMHANKWIPMSIAVIISMALAVFRFRELYCREAAESEDDDTNKS